MKKKLIMAVGLGLVAFAGMFALARFTGQAPTSASAEVSRDIDRQSADGPIVPHIMEPGMRGGLDDQMRRSMTEKQLKSLIHEVRDRIEEYNDKLEGLKSREQRLEMAQEQLQQDIKRLVDLRNELAATVVGLKEERDRLDKSRVAIAKTEQANIVTMAATYDKMDPTSASTILMDMSKTPNGSANDAVKILYYMTDRTKANLLATLAESEPKLAAYFCQQLKHVVEEK